MSSTTIERNWTKLIEKYHSRDCSQLEFCKSEGISASTLQNHLRRSIRRKEKFLPLSEIISESPEELELEFSNGLSIKIRI